MRGNEQSPLVPQNTKIIEHEFPTDVEEQARRLLLCVNIGPKAITHLLTARLLGNSPASTNHIPSDVLMSEFGKAFQGSEFTRVNSNTALAYGLWTLCPRGLVSEIHTLPYWGEDKLIGFGLTPAGINYGVPATALAVWFEKEHGLSLYPSLGSVPTRSKDMERAPYTRSLILKLLNEKKRLTQDQIVEALKINQTVAQTSLVALAEAGTIDYDAVTPKSGKRKVDYKYGEMSPDQIQTFKTYTIFTKLVVEICEDLRKAKKEVTQADVYEKISEDIISKSNEKNLRSVVNRILSDLSRQGYLTRGAFKGAKTQAWAEINNIGEAVAKDFLIPLWNFLEGNPETVRWLKAEIVPHVFKNIDEFARNSGDLYYPYSVSFRKTNLEISLAETVRIIREYEKGISVADLAPKLGLKVVSVRQRLASMLGTTLDRESRNGIFYYRLKL